MTTATQTTTGTGIAFEPLAVNPDGIRQSLKERPQWVVWKLEERNDEMTKVLYSPWTLERASTTDLMTWASFEGAMIMYQKHGFDGIGFVFSSGDPFTGIDLDGVRDPETGDLEPWAQKVIESFPKAYTEVSPSGRGVHIIVRGKFPRGKKKSGKKGSIEVYGQERYFTITGVAL